MPVTRSTNHICTSRYSWLRSSKYYLPLPILLSVVTTFLPLVTAGIIPLATGFVAGARNRRSDTASSRSVDFSKLLSILDHLFTIIPTALASFTISYFTPGDIVGCRLENQWQSYYSSKNANAIRAIQDRLQCCGFRSTRDRGWPFPGGSEHQDCSSTFGYTRSCFAGWQSTQREAAALVFTAALLSLIMKMILSSRGYGLSTRYTRLPFYEAIDDDDASDARNGNNSQRRFITDAGYRDEPAEGERDRPSSPAHTLSPNLNANPFGVTNDRNDAGGNDYHDGSSGALHFSNLRP
ncbi:hypothetical protein AJ79_10191 [Helicocarpus griseus UAMH5409]|uniref:Tetraspanin Tsp3 n=1 Tax=Helicocarpus griseus UAMH5409 TaxID=1447875 RepID=A0A2B7WF52_9EURO|nr:hypothetical protein AJ79_10191 [Helicocarpus griseus UAMH5409]